MCQITSSLKPSEANVMAPSGLKYESLRNPLGVDVPEHWYSWLLKSPVKG